LQSSLCNVSIRTGPRRSRRSELPWHKLKSFPTYQNRARLRIQSGFAFYAKL
jgi:hypothetical protein